MKKTKLIIALVSVVMVTSLFASLAIAKDESSPLAQIWNAIFGIQEDMEDLQTRVDELEVASGATRYVIEGSFDITADGDLIEYGGPSEYHYKRIDVSQLTLSDMPLVQVYAKPYLGDPEQRWTEYDQNVDYDEGCVYIEYKMYMGMSGIWIYFITGDYKIVVVK